MSEEPPQSGEQPNSQLPPIVMAPCSSCGALCELGAKSCWMCLSNLDGSNPYASHVDVQSPVQPTTSRYETLFRVLLLICVVLAILIGVGIASEDPGGLIPYAILVGPAFLVTGVRALWQLASEGKTSASALFVSFLVSGAITVSVLAILLVAGILLLFVLCFYEISKL